MKMRMICALIAALVMAFAAAGCGVEIAENTFIKTNAELTTADEDATGDEEVTAEEEIVPVIIETPTPEGPPTYEEVKIKPSAIAYTEFSKEYNAESGSLNGTAGTADSRTGFKGTGYVTGLTEENDWVITFDLPEKQYYNITLTAGADSVVRNGLSVNGEKISEFTSTGTGLFEAFTFKNILLEKGANQISVVPEDGGIDIDHIEVTASDEIEKLSLTLKDPALSNKDSAYNARALYKYLCDSFGSRILLGQYDTIGTDYESQLMLKTTGKLPAIRFGDLMYVTSADDEKQKSASAEIKEAVAWSRQGGVVGYMWNWTAPTDPENTESIYSDSTDFDLSKAVTEENIANLTAKEIEALRKDGKISEECALIINDIDKAAEQLKVLRDEGAAVIWRPLQEASNGYYWWGCDEESYKWLWKLMYDRMTVMHGLNNLIWVWSAQNAGWYVGNSSCDVLSVDVYSGNKDGQVNSLIYLQSIAQNKPIAMSECGSFPKMQSIADQKAMWSYIGQWGGSFVVGEDGGLNEEHNSLNDIITVYNNELTVTLDKLPDFISAAEELKKADENSSSDTESSSSGTDSSSSGSAEDDSSKA